MRVRDVGPPRVEVDGVEYSLSGSKQAAILCRLAVDANERVAIGELIAAGWGYDENVSTSSVENHIWRLRRLMQPGRVRTASSVLVNDTSGYRLLADPDQLDSLAFERLAAVSRIAAEAGDPEGVLRASDEAMPLWRGAPYEVIAHVTSGVAAAARLEELRGQVVERRIDALLSTSQPDQALAELDGLLAVFPFRERLWAQRMTGLAHSGRTEEALATYRRARALMLEELGIEPGAVLRAAHETILAGESDDRPVSPKRVVASGPVRLPPRPGPLIGRASELAELSSRLCEGRSMTLVGPGGTGKTRLAIEAAAATAVDHPAGVWFVDLTEIADDRLVADAVVSALGIESAGGSAVDTLAEFAHDRRLLIVLDNCEHVLDGAASVFDAITAGGSAANVLATSREPLAAVTESVLPVLPLSFTRTESGQARSAAAQLFVARVPEGITVDVRDEEIIQRICIALDGLPLALELAAARAGSFTLSEIAEQVVSDPSRLARIGRGPADHRSTVRSMIEWSHRLLPTIDQTVHRRLSVLPGAFTLPLATAVAQTGGDLDVLDVAGALARLAHRSLLMSTRTGRRSGPATFHQLETVRAHARHELDDAAETAAALRGRQEWVLTLLEARPALGADDCIQWYDAIEDVYPSVRAVLEGAVSPEPDLRLIRAACGLLFFWYFRSRVVEARGWAFAALSVVGLPTAGEPEPPEIVLLRVVAAATALLSEQAPLAAEQLQLALPVAAAVPGELAGDMIEALTGASDGAWAHNEYGLAREVAAALQQLAERSGDSASRLLAAQTDCSAGLAERELTETARLAEVGYQQGVGQRNYWAQWTFSAVRMIVATLDGQPTLGLEWMDRLIPAHIRFGAGGGGVFVESLANLAALSGEYEVAARLYGAAHAEIRRVGMLWPTQLGTGQLLETVRTALAADRFDRLFVEGSALSYEDIAQERGLLPGS